MLSDRAKLAGDLIYNGVRFRWLRATGHSGRPTVVSIEITHDCIARCIMCNIWKIPHDVPSLSVDQWLQILALPLFSNLIELDITGLNLIIPPSDVFRKEVR